MNIKTYIGGGTKKLVATDKSSIRPAGTYLPLFITQLIGGRNWSLAVVRVGCPRTTDPYEFETTGVKS